MVVELVLETGPLVLFFGAVVFAAVMGVFA